MQKHEPGYGRHEPANKLSYREIAAYLKRLGGDFERGVLPRMKLLATDALRCAAISMDPTRLEHNF